MRLFTQVEFVVSNDAETTQNKIASKLVDSSIAPIKQTIPFADSGDATIEAGDTYTLPWGSATSSRSRLLDLSVDGACRIRINQDGVNQDMRLCGSAKLPARCTLTLAGSVASITILSLEATDDVTATWMFAEMTDPTDSTYFPVV